MDPLDLWKSLANHLELTWEVDPIGRVINVGEEFSIFFKLRNTAAATDEWGDDVRPDIAFGEPKLRIIPRGEVDLFTDNGSLTSTGATFRFPHVRPAEGGAGDDTRGPLPRERRHELVRRGSCRGRARPRAFRVRALLPHLVQPSCRGARRSLVERATPLAWLQ